MTNPITASAPRLRIVLSSVLLLLIGAGVVLGILGLRYLRDYAHVVNEVVVNADNRNTHTNQLRLDIAEYKQNANAVQLAKEVVAERESYQYQDDAYRDLLAIAKKAKLSIRQYRFSDTDPSANSSSGQQVVAQSSASGLRPSYIAVTLANPVDYVSFLNFLHYIEQNLTKMQIEKVSLSSAFRDGVNDTIITDELVIKVFTK